VSQIKLAKYVGRWGSGVGLNDIHTRFHENVCVNEKVQGGGRNVDIIP